MNSCWEGLWRPWLCCFNFKSGVYKKGRGVKAQRLSVWLAGNALFLSASTFSPFLQPKRLTLDLVHMFQSQPVPTQDLLTW